MATKKFNKNINQTQNITFPTAFLERMKTLLGGEYEAFLQALNEPKQSAIFVNQKMDLDEFKKIVDFKISPITYEKRGFYVEQKLGKHPLHHAGAFYCQEPSAMFTVNAHKFRGDECVLDMCASPGGKSIQIANRIPNGVLVSNEINNARSSILFSNIERMGLKNVIVTNDTPSNIAKAYGGEFDVVLVDAPCSGEGMFRRGEQVVCEWNENLPQMCAERQFQILVEADKVLKQNGTLIYSTCTYSIEENEGLIKKFLDEFDYQLVNIQCDLPRGIDMPEAVRLYPHKVKGEGQFVALLKKLGENNNSPAATLRLKASSVATKFVEQNTNIGLTAFEYGDYAYVVTHPEMLKKGVNYYSIGVRAGQVKDMRFEPAHNLFTAFGKNFKLNLDYPYTSNEVSAYLKGDVLNADLLDGYGSFLASHCAVGGFKIAGGKFKNHYPKGLRNT